MNKQELIKEYELHHFNGDPEALEILLAAVVANFMDGAPVWLLFIGASGAGKSSIIEMFGFPRNAKKKHYLDKNLMQCTKIWLHFVEMPYLNLLQGRKRF